MYFFFFKQKTAYEMRISDWSSDVCSSDLTASCAVEAIGEAGIGGFDRPDVGRRNAAAGAFEHRDRFSVDRKSLARRGSGIGGVAAVQRYRVGRAVGVTLIMLEAKARPGPAADPGEIGRASRTERVCQ